MSSKSPAFSRPLWIVALWGAFNTAYGADAAPLPGAGSILQEIKPPAPAAPPARAPELNYPSHQVVPSQDTTLFSVEKIEFSGNTLFSSQILHSLVADGEGKKLNLASLQEIAARITEYYRQQGYPLSRAYIPPQSISQGVVTIKVLEVKYGEVHLQNSSRVDNSLVNATLAPLGNGEAIQSQTLDRALLLLSDLPELQVGATLKPGRNVGSSDLEVEALPRTTSYANLNLDNYGNRYIGRTRLTGTGYLLNPLRHGDTLTASAITTGEGMNYGRLGYDITLNGQGTRLGGSYSTLYYKLSGTASALDAHGTADITSLWVKHPLTRGKQFNLYGQVEFDAKQLRDHVDTSQTKTDRKLANWVLSLNGDHRDGLLGGGVNVWSLGWTSGQVSFDNREAKSADAQTAKSSGGFAKVNGNFSRLQGLTAKDSFYLNLSFQWANENLDSGEKMSVGGPYNVRAYDIGAVSGDSGYLGTLEYHRDLGNMGGGNLQGVAFLDSAHVNVNRHPWTASSNSATLSGAGLGANWNGPDLWRVSVYVASRLGALPSVVTKPSQFTGWLVVNKAF